VWIVPPYLPYAPALAAAGVDLARLHLVHCATPNEALWAYEQALRAPECAVAFAWLATADQRALRRLAVAAREGRTFGVLWRRPGQHAQALAAALRLHLAPHHGQLAVQVQKRRGGELANPLLLDIERMHAATRAGVIALPRQPVLPLPLPLPAVPLAHAASA
jgi:cell division inhibitor SulA/protein ImuA